MQAYLIIGEEVRVQEEIEKLSVRLKARIMEYPLRLIEDVRNLNSLTRLTLTEKTLVVAKRVDEATEAALNAFLKNLEEPQENLYYALSAVSLHQVLPTVVSRCRVVKVSGEKVLSTPQVVEEFLRGSASQRLLIVDKIKGRKEAAGFTSDIVLGLHQKLVRGENYPNLALGLRLSQTTLERIGLNGNVTLQLANLAISFP